PLHVFETEMTIPRKGHERVGQRQHDNRYEPLHVLTCLDVYVFASTISRQAFYTVYGGAGHRRGVSFCSLRTRYRYLRTNTPESPSKARMWVQTRSRNHRS